MKPSLILPEPLRPPMAPLAASILESRIPARLAWTSPTGDPRLVPLWFHWSGDRLELATFAGSQKLGELVPGDLVAVSIDTDEFPYRALKLRGPIEIRPVRGLAPCYRLAAERYLGPTNAARWLASLAGRDQSVIAITPTWAKLSDMADAPFFRDESGRR